MSVVGQLSALVVTDNQYCGKVVEGNQILPGELRLSTPVLAI